MSFVEFGRCSPREYRAHMPRRVQETSLAIGQLYLLMIALKSGGRGPKAAKIPALIHDKGAAASAKPPGLTSITFALLNQDLQPFPKVGNISASFSDGLWVDPQTNLHFTLSNHKDPFGVRSGYFRSYDDGIADGPELFSNISSDVRELTTV